MTKILLSYSYHHFDPDKPLDKQPRLESSAGILAKTFYDILSEIGEVTYTDASRYKEHLGKDFDLFVGIASHFQDIIKANLINIKKSVYVAVNMHPYERNKILKKALKDLDLPATAISGQDLVNPKPYLEAIDMADFILCFGNVSTYNSYLKHGVSKSKIKLVNYGLASDPLLSSPKASANKRRYLYAASEIGLRKGFDLLYETVASDRLVGRDFQLDIVGEVATPYYEKKLKKLQERFGDKIKYHGWIDSSSLEYKELLSNSDFLLFPSLEEGQAGTIIDSIAYGVVPIITPNSGIDFSPLGNFAITGKKRLPHNVDLIVESLKLDIKSVQTLKKKTKEYYNEFHRDFRDLLKETLRRIVEEDALYPLVSVILPIYNKETTILGLIERLDLALRQYPAVELHIIFDGCLDNTEKLVRKYYRRKPPYRITFTVTPNVFEIKTTNLGLRKSVGKYCILIQDDNYVYDPDFIYEAINFLDKDPSAVILGGLAGVNFYPRGTTGLKGKGQITINEDEVYWRQDVRTDSRLKDRIFQVDACMRGPLFIRKSFLEKYGYMDEIYAPLYEDDMDLCMRAASKNYKVYCILMDVENKSLSMAHADPEKSNLFSKTIKRNTDIFYKRWRPSTNKRYSWIHRTRMIKQPMLSTFQPESPFSKWKRLVRR